MRVDIDNENRVRKFTYSQSWLNTFAKCPEQARLQMLGVLPRRETDALSIGTAMHTGIETVLRGGTDQQAIDASMAKFDELAALEEFEWVQIKTPETAKRTIHNALWAWYEDVLPLIDEAQSIEQRFDFFVSEVPDQDGWTNEVWLGGTWDCADSAPFVWDWKTAARPYENWEVQRWYIQPTVYGWGHAHVSGSPLGLTPFRYAVMIKDAQRKSRVQFIDVQRTWEHTDWLTRQMHSIVDLWLATDGGFKPWPLNDHGWHCSPKWCSAWSSCKGKFLTMRNP